MSDVKRCAACRKEKPVSEMKTCMHAEMHNYVCDSKCMRDFYSPPKAEKPDYDALLAERNQLRAQVEEQLPRLIDENHKLRAELAAIRGQQIVGRVHHNPDHPKPVRAVLNSAGRQLPDDARLYALPPQQPDAVSVPMELLDVGQLIRTQDNRCTDAPLFAVMKKQAIVTSPNHDYDYIEWVNVEDDYVVASEAQARRLEALYEGGRDAPEGWERFAMKEIDVFVTACFTEQGCKDFLARDGHNHRKPFIYAFGSYRNAEFRAIREWLAALPTTRQAEEDEPCAK